MVVVSGAGAAGVAVTKLLARAGVADIVVCDSRGIISPARTDLVEHKHRLAATTNPRGLAGSLTDALVGADVFVGVSGGKVPEADIARMAPDSIIFALANPDPEVHPDVASKYAAVVATGRSDFPNQINNVLAIPRDLPRRAGLGAPQITEAMKLAAARAIADLVERPTDDEIVPSVFAGEGGHYGRRGRRKTGLTAEATAAHRAHRPQAHGALVPILHGPQGTHRWVRVRSSAGMETAGPSPPVSGLVLPSAAAPLA